MKIDGLYGYTVVRNGLRLDYCFQEAINSLLRVCESVLVCDSDSDDGTTQLLAAWAQREPRLRIVNMPWTDPRGDVRWFVGWINYARKHLQPGWQLMLDADEVLGEQSEPAIRYAMDERRPLYFKRLNFWQDARHIAPARPGGVQISDCVVRLGPSSLWMPSDEPYAANKEPSIRRHAIRHDSAVIYHYGFLRKDEAFKRKSKECIRIWFNSEDERIARATKDGVPWRDYFPLSVPLEPFRAAHPRVALKWLIERNCL